jgi:type IV pilus assembly protein PilM
MSVIDSTGPVGAAFAVTDLVGAAAAQLRPKQSTLNLLPPSRRQVVTSRQRLPWLIAAAVLTLGVMLPPLIHFRAVTNEARKKAAAIERELAPLRERDMRIRAAEELQERRTSWLGLLGGLQERLARVEDVWLEKLQPTTGAAGAPLRLVVAGRLLDRSSPLARPSPEAYRRATALLSSLVDSPFVAAVESERFDRSQPGVLKFEFVLVTESTRPL